MKLALAALVTTGLATTLAVVRADAPKPDADPTSSYLDRRAKAWVDSPPPIANIPCAISCHTTFPYLLVRPQLGKGDPAIRTAFEARLPVLTAGTAMPFYGKRGSARAKQSIATEAVLTAIALAASDRGGVSKATQTAIDFMWTQQRADGGFDWLDFGIEPWEAGSDWGNIMAIAIGNGEQEHSRLATGNGRKLIDYLKTRLADTKRPIKPHDRAALLWMSRVYDSPNRVLTEAQRAPLTADLIKTQRPDGGFSLAIWLGRTPTQSDGYATALGVLALCDGAPGQRRPEVIKALDWLVAHEADNGSYPSPAYGSSTARAKGYASDAATAYAVISLHTCKR